MKKLTLEEKTDTYGSGIPGLILYGSAIMSTINTFMMNSEINVLEQENKDLETELNSKSQPVNIDIPFFY